MPRSPADWDNGKGLQPLIQLPSFRYTPVLGWSSTRPEIFRSCRRRYFYQYYGKYDREIPMGRILHMKTLSSIPMTIGTGVHDILAPLLTRLQKSDWDLDHGRLDQHVETSVQKLLSGTKLQEVYYKERPPPSLEAFRWWHPAPSVSTRRQCCSLLSELDLTEGTGGHAGLDLLEWCPSAVGWRCRKW